MRTRRAWLAFILVGVVIYVCGIEIAGSSLSGALAAGAAQAALPSSTPTLVSTAAPTSLIYPAPASRGVLFDSQNLLLVCLASGLVLIIFGGAVWGSRKPKPPSP